MKNQFVAKIAYREELKPSDLESVREIVCSSGFFSDAEVEIALELVNERLNKGIASGYHFLFAEHAGKVIGYACFGPVAGTKVSYNLYWVAVRDDFRGLGIGKKLLAKTEKEIAEMEGRRIYIETSSREQYELTRSFYKNCGYQEEALLKDFYAPGDSKIIYVKEIPTISCHVSIKD